MSPAFSRCLATIAFLFVPAPLLALESYRVTGLKSGDALTVREEPYEGGKLSDWKEIGSIPEGASDVLGTGRSKLVSENRWFEVAFGSARGWVNSKFLEATDPTDLKGETFNCAGTEPFWGVTLGPAGSEYSDPEIEAVQLKTERVQPATARLFPLLYRLTDASGRKFTATVSEQSWCSDGMSDYDYAFQVLFSSEEEFQQGCCRLKR